MCPFEIFKYIWTLMICPFQRNRYIMLNSGDASFLSQHLDEAELWRYVHLSESLEKANLEMNPMYRNPQIKLGSSYMSLFQNCRIKLGSGDISFDTLRSSDTAWL